MPSRLCTSSRGVPRGAKNCASSSLLSTPRREATLLPFPTLHAGVQIPWRLRRTCVSGWVVTRESLVSEVFAVVGAGSLLAPGQKCSCHVRHDSTAQPLWIFNAQFANNSRKWCSFDPLPPAANTTPKERDPLASFQVSKVHRLIRANFGTNVVGSPLCTDRDRERRRDLKFVTLEDGQDDRHPQVDHSLLHWEEKKRKTRQISLCISTSHLP